MNPYLAEFVGTAILVLLGNGVVANVVLHQSKGQNGGWMVVTAGWGLGVAIAVYPKKENGKIAKTRQVT